MSARRIMSIYSKDTLVIFKVNMHGMNLLEFAIKKISTLHNHSNLNLPQAASKLAELDNKVATHLDAINSDLKKIKNKLKSLSVNDRNTKLKPLQTRSFIFGNRSVFNLIRLVEVYDQYFSYLRLSKSTSLFDSNTQAHKVNAKKKHELFSLLSLIAFSSTKQVSCKN